MSETENVIEYEESFLSYRKQIDLIDQDLISLLQQRLELVDEIGNYKKEHGLPVEDKVREAEKLDAIRKMTDESRQETICRLFAQIMAICKDRQNGLV